NDFTFSFAPLALVGFLISLGAAIRLSNFNIDAEQRYEFKGLPAPANALFIVALPLLMEHPLFAFLKPLLSTYTALLFIVILSAVLMNVRLSLFSFKIQTFSIRDYGFQMFLVILALPSFYFLQWAAVPVMIVLYLFLNVIRNSFK
ncbi:phosphatidylserine synthase, partial [Flavobacteriaceae bacterium]|nr:phosphatidylserine synthase [Flavobacteriaceae bacterium]